MCMKCTDENHRPFRWHMANGNGDAAHLRDFCDLRSCYGIFWKRDTMLGPFMPSSMLTSITLALTSLLALRLPIQSCESDFRTEGRSCILWDSAAQMIIWGISIQRDIFCHHSCGAWSSSKNLDHTKRDSRSARQNWESIDIRLSLCVIYLRSSSLFSDFLFNKYIHDF